LTIGQSSNSNKGIFFITNSECERSVAANINTEPNVKLISKDIINVYGCVDCPMLFSKLLFGLLVFILLLAEISYSSSLINRLEYSMIKSKYNNIAGD